LEYLVGGVIMMKEKLESRRESLNDESLQHHIIQHTGKPRLAIINETTWVGSFVFAILVA